MTDQERIDKALDTLMEICDLKGDDANRDEAYQRKSAAEEILRHYRERAVFHSFVTEGIKVRIEGHLPVRPVVRGES